MGFHVQMALSPPSAVPPVHLPFPPSAPLTADLPTRRPAPDQNMSHEVVGAPAMSGHHDGTNTAVPKPTSIPAITPKQEPQVGAAMSSREECIWDIHFNSLLLFQKTNGHINVSPNHPETYKLAQWLNQQKSRKLIPEYQSQKLQALEGFNVDAATAIPPLEEERDHLPFIANNKRDYISAYDSKWKQMYERLTLFVLVFKHANVPFSYKENGIALGPWVARQRLEKRKGTIRQDREEKLAKLNFVWENYKQRVGEDATNFVGHVGNDDATADSTSPTPKKIIPGPNDVVCGKDKFAQRHAGNSNFNFLIESRVKTMPRRSAILGIQSWVSIPRVVPGMVVEIRLPKSSITATTRITTFSSPAVKRY
jgi:hypothetical protein